MLRSLYSGVNGMKAFQSRMDVIGNNIANSNTTGYKNDRTSFSDSLHQTLNEAKIGDGTSRATPSVQIGSGVARTTVKTDFSQGGLTQTGVATDLAISGEGFFMVREATSNVQFATRAGDFRLDSNGYLVTNTGLRVQGYSDAALSTVGDVRVDATGAPATASAGATVAAFSISPDGKISVRLTDGTQFTRGQVLLQKFSDPQQLTKEGGNLYSNTDVAGPLGGAPGTPAAAGTNGLGRIESGALELSNVDLAEEFTGLITSQRGFQASARLITTSDEVLQEVINLKR